MQKERIEGMRVIMIMLAIAFVQVVYSQNQVVGYVYYQGDENDPMENVDVNLYDSENTVLYSTQTDVNGWFEFNNVGDGPYVVRSACNDEVTGVDLTDAYYLLLYLLDMYEFNSIQMLAADVDGNNKVDWVDYIIFVINYLLEEEPFPVGDWVSTEHQVEFSNRAEGDTLSVANSEAGNTLLGGGRFLDIVQVSHQEVKLFENSYTVDLSVDNIDEVAGINLRIQYPMDMIRITDVNGPDETFEYRIDQDNGILSFIWVDQEVGTYNEKDNNAIASITFETIENQHTHGQFSLLPNGSFIGHDGGALGEVQLTLPELVRDVESIKVVTAYPNPAINQFTISIDSELHQTAELLVYDINGRLIDSQSLLLSEGINGLVLDTEEYMPGHYIYVIDFGDPSATSFVGRMYKSSR